ncbi:hypothetical protein BT96DRAFT_944420 [Gymnopus androsaceus JB14]|uniref:Uncharacterized protein n=1 Tax=Gymnopus androsaceus JB14 TaxID=1447944 RepID=A0A6A4H6J4_9AGAR|nr:hypothetical protein BT96DRAFT_944420 [Gymnopus androsaceus JB14]
MPKKRKGRIENFNQGGKKWAIGTTARTAARKLGYNWAEEKGKDLNENDSPESPSRSGPNSDVSPIYISSAWALSTSKHPAQALKCCVILVTCHRFKQKNLHKSVSSELWTHGFEKLILRKFVEVNKSACEKSRLSQNCQIKNQSPRLRHFIIKHRCIHYGDWLEITAGKLGTFSCNSVKPNEGVGTEFPVALVPAQDSVLERHIFPILIINDSLEATERTVRRTGTANSKFSEHPYNGGNSLKIKSAFEQGGISGLMVMIRSSQSLNGRERGSTPL